MYRYFFKRLFDFVISFISILVLSPMLLILIILGAIFMKGNPFFVQYRPGKNEKIFRLIKFRTMSNAKDKEGNLLPDNLRLNKYGRFLRSTSLDELPELFNILKGDMAIVGPRPQLVSDMLFMSDEQRKRHSVRQGLTGLAQVSGRNNISWEERISYDLKYINDGISLWRDLKIIFKTIINVFKRKDVATDGMETSEDLGVYLLRIGKITEEEFVKNDKTSKELIKNLKK